MPITITTNDGEYTGPNLHQAITDRYGPRAEPYPTRDPNNPRWGNVVEMQPGGFAILAEIISVEGEEDADSGAVALQQAGEAHAAMEEHEISARKAMEARNLAIRQAARAGVTQAEISRRLGLGRSMIDRIVHGR